MSRFVLKIGFALALFEIVSCSPTDKGAAPTANVKGTVTLDGKLIPTGEIHFVLPGVPPTVLTITDGAYAGPVPVGKAKVEVFQYVEGAPSEKYGGTRTPKNIIPGKYWGPNTLLEATVAAGEPNEFKFELRSR